ncbi:MAG TPA: serine/threonine-protein kinase, partial [Steroidobacteraceae bacterium]|nr:serine/threonine-protein kinase [Steroidobacteraceae bacterium]
MTEESLLRRVSTFAEADKSQLQHWISEVRAELTAGRLSSSTADRVLATLTSADMRTRVAADPTQVQIPATLLRPAPQASLDSDATLEKQSIDSTERKVVPNEGDATQRKIAATLIHAPDATLRIEQGTGTVARTLRMPLATPVASTEAFPPTRDSADRTHVIAERLVKSLDNLEAPHHGPLQPGTVIKQRFVLEKLVGKGGMGLVFSALDRRKEEARDPNPRVALKVLNADFRRHPQSLIALQREARKAQTLAHPNVVTVFDFDRDGDAVYMTMELLKGRALEVLVREARGKGASPEIALPIIRGIAEGLAYAHRKGIVHSDLKPGNIFVLEDGTPKILDFGIARAVPNSAATETPDDFDAGTLGAYTEAYATHEMVEGVDPHPADDMYSLGIIAYELLTGFHPYQRHSAPKARKLGVKPPPLKGLKLREARALERCLSFDRAQRPQDAAEFLKLFRGVTALQKTLIAATVILTVAAGF